MLKEHHFERHKKPERFETDYLVSVMCFLPGTHKERKHNELFFAKERGKKLWWCLMSCGGANINLVKNGNHWNGWLLLYYAKKEGFTWSIGLLIRP